MLRAATAILVIGSLTATSAMSADPVSVKGSTIKYAPTVSVKVGDKPIDLKLTGVGLRSKATFKVYTIGSYLQDGTTVRTPEELTKVEAVRMLHLVMERTVESDEFIDAFKSAIGKSYPADKFASEFKQIAEAMGKTSVKKGDQVMILYTPGVGVHLQVMGKADLTIKNADFAQALWEVYFGAKPLDQNMKKGLFELLSK